MSMLKEFDYQSTLQIMEAEASRLKAEEKVALVAKHHRIQNSPGIDAAIFEMVEVFEKAGIETKVEEFQSDNHTFYQDYLTPGGWIGYRGQLNLCETGETLADFTEGPIQLIQRSCSTRGQEELEIFIVDDIERIRQEKPNLQGKILLTKQNIHMVKDLIHDPFGARGLIFDGMRLGKGREGGVMDHARQYTSFWWLKDEEPTFGFVLTPAQGEKLRAKIQAGEQVRVNCEVEAEFLDNSLKVLHARIPGKGVENILLVAHICHPYPSVNDNASGVGAGVEVMLFIQQLLQEKKLAQLERGIELILVPEFSGSFAFLDRYLKTGHYCAGLNLDMVGQDQEKCGSTLLVETPPLVTPGRTGELLFTIIEEITQNYSFRIREAEFNGGSDHQLLSDPFVGIPCPMIIQLPDRYYHTDQDTLDKLDSVILRCVTLAAAVYAYYLATVDDQGLTKVLEGHTAAYDEKMMLLKQKTYERKLTSVEEELARIVPVRKYWGFSSLSQKRPQIAQERLEELWQVVMKDSYYASVLALYWADGQRNLLEILDLLELETGKREPELIRGLFTILHDAGSIEFKKVV